MNAKAKLYRLPGSHYAARAELLLHLKGVPYERVNLTHLNFGRILRPISGQDEVPLLVDGADIVTWRKIPDYLEARYPEPRLVPREAAEREACDLIETWADLTWGHLVRRLGFNEMRRDRRLAARFFGGGVRGLATAAIAVPWTVRNYGIAPFVVDHDEQVLDETVRRFGALIDRHGNLVSKELTRADVAVAALTRPLLRVPKYEKQYGESALFRWVERTLADLKARRGSA